MFPLRTFGTQDPSHRSRTARPLLLLLTLALVAIAPPARAATRTWDFDTAHSGATFKVRHIFTMVPGHFSDFTGAVQYDDKNPENSSVEVTIQSASITTDNAKRDGHLKSPDFFDVEKFPTVTFKSTKMEKTDKSDMFKVAGDLTMHGVTKSIVLNVQILGMGPDPFNPSGGRAGFLATTTISRKDFGIIWNKVLDNGSTLLGDEVQIEFPVEAVKRSS